MNYNSLNVSNDLDPMKLENAYSQLMGKQNYYSSNPNASPNGNFFIPYGYHETTYRPNADPSKAGTLVSSGGLKSATSPYSGGGGKWICTEMLKRGVINREDYRRLSYAHALAILRHPNFCFWYLKHAKELVKEMNRAGYSWRQDGKRFFEGLKEIYTDHGFETAFKFYRLFCRQAWLRYGSHLPDPDSVKFGLLKFLKERWLWRNLFRWEVAKS